MLGRTLASYLVFAATVAALPQGFVLDIGSMDGAVLHAPLPNTTTAALSSTTAFQTPIVTSRTLTFNFTTITNSTTAALNSTMRTIRLPTTTIVTTQPNPIPRPATTTERYEDEDTLAGNEQNHDTAATFSNSSVSEPLSKWPHWFTAATFTLMFYDILTLGVFLWLWVFGYLWWFRWGGGMRASERRWGRRGAISVGLELVRMDVTRLDRSGQYGRSNEWVRTGRGYGRMRSENWEMTRSARGTELENEMRRLGMI